MRPRRGLTVTVAALCLALLVGFAAAASDSIDDVAVLLYGIVRLAGSELAVSAAQAHELQPVVQAWRDLLEQPEIMQGSSDTAAAIRAILAPEQLAAIEAMDLTSEDAVRWSNAALTGYMWRHTNRAAGPWSPVPLIKLAGKVVRLLSGWGSP